MMGQGLNWPNKYLFGFYYHSKYRYITCLFDIFPCLLLSFPWASLWIQNIGRHPWGIKITWNCLIFRTYAKTFRFGHICLWGRTLVRSTQNDPKRVLSPTLSSLSSLYQTNQWFCVRGSCSKFCPHSSCSWNCKFQLLKVENVLKLLRKLFLTAMKKSWQKLWGVIKESYRSGKLYVQNLSWDTLAEKPSNTSKAGGENRKSFLALFCTS